MKLILLTTICCTLLASGSSFTGRYKIESNSFNKEIAKTHSSRIHRRSLGTLFGFNQNLSPIKISITFGNANQQVVPNNQRTWSQPKTSRRPNNQRTRYQPTSYRNNYPFIQIQKHFYFPNGNYNNNVRRKNQQHPAELRTTTIRPSITTEWPSFENVKTTGKVQVALEEIPVSIAPTPKLIFTTEQTPVVELSTESSLKMQDILVPTTTSTPLIERPTTTTSTTTLAPSITNDISTRYEMETKGGFTSTSEPRSDEFSELIYDIDPRH